jgi:DNA polymerase III delta prime subunit
MSNFHLLSYLNHHAYFVHSFKDSINNLKEHLKDKFGIEHSQNPDFFHEKYESLSIDESRRIKESHLSKGFIEGSKRIFIIETDSITHEAQNSLLKIFEEPNEDTHFFLVMPSVEVLLPTLRSRLYILNSPDETQSGELIKTAQSFLKMNMKDRVAFVDDLAKRISDDEATRNDAIEFLAALEISLYKNNLEKNRAGLEAILKARTYLNDRSPSVKQLLEYVALSL